MTDRETLRQLREYARHDDEKVVVIRKGSNVGPTTELLSNTIGTLIAEADTPSLGEISMAIARHSFDAMLRGDTRKAERLAVIRDQLVVLLQEQKP